MITAQELLDELTRQAEDAEAYLREVQEEYKTHAFLSSGRLERAQDDAIEARRAQWKAERALAKLAR